MSLLADIAAGKLAPVYVLYGSEHAPMRAVVEALRAKLLDPAMAAFNHERFVGRDLEGPGKVLEACAQVPMLASHRLVELDEPEAIGKGRAAAPPKLLDPLVDYIAAPYTSTVLVLTSSSIDARSRLVTAAKKHGVVEKFEGLRRTDDAVVWVREHARATGVVLDGAAAETLVERVGNSPSALTAALEQAAIYAGAGAKVGVAEVTAVVTDAREAVVFDLTDAVGMGKHARALAVLRRMFSQGDGGMAEAGPLLAMLARQLRMLLVAHGCGLRSGELERAASLPPFIARKMIDQAKRFSVERLHRAFAALVRLDGDLKGGSFVVSREAQLGLERWILEACNALPGVAPR
jgi:DNA polymerase III subunit delta